MTLRGHNFSLKSKKLFLFVEKHQYFIHLENQLVAIHAVAYFFIFRISYLHIFARFATVLDYILLIFYVRVHAWCSYLIGETHIPE